MINKCKNDTKNSCLNNNLLDTNEIKLTNKVNSFEKKINDLKEKEKQ